MLRVALKMLLGDRAKYVGLLFGITFTSFLVTFAASYFCGFMTRGFALIAENPTVDVWVMDPAVDSPEQTVNMPDSALDRVRSVDDVLSAVPLALGTADVRFPNGHVQPFQIIGVDDATLSSVPRLRDGVSPAVLRAPDAAIVDPGGTEGKLETPLMEADQWPSEPHLNVATRPLTMGDELLVNDNRVRIAGTADDFKADTVWWFLVNSEDVGDIGAMLSLAMSVGFGITGIMLYMFTTEALRQYAVLKAMGATPRLLLAMIFAQAGLCALLGTGLGLGLCAIIGQIAVEADYPFRMMWFTPLVGGMMVLVVSIVSAAMSARPVLKLEPAMVFA